MLYLCFSDTKSVHLSDWFDLVLELNSRNNDIFIEIS